MNFNIVTEFENKIATFFGAPYAIAVDSCTHGIELCLRYTNASEIKVPDRTYLSVPFLAPKLGIKLNWTRGIEWTDYYHVTDQVIDAAVLWKQNSYLPNTFMNISFQYQKHLSLGRGGVILTDNKEAALQLKKMSYDGRLPNIPWRQQNIDTIGYHYYMTPETAQLGLNKLETAINTTARQWVYTDWPDLTQMKIFDDSQLSLYEYCEKHNITPYLQTK
jgi:dTDP-4-amino-4,6-dideoxygalactose transaminase